jgi:hypothetical protein
MKRQVFRRVLVGNFIALFFALASKTAAISDPPLSAGNPVTPGAPQEFTGVGGTNTSVTAGSANAALTAFEAAIGGINNGANPPPASGGFRVINWDAVKLDGTDFGGDTTVIDPNNVVGIPIQRFEERGVIFDEVYAVSGPASASNSATFTTVNTNVASASPALFPAFSPTKTFAMFNDNGIGLRFVLASPHTFAGQQAATRGFGAIFLNVELPSTTSIEYFNGDISLGKFFAPTGTQGQAEFLGVLFNDPIVTSVQITCGTDVLFSFDGITFHSGGVDNPGTNHNLVVVDDFVYAEPTKALNAQPDILATAGTLFTGPVATFTDLDPNGTAANFTATITWGDGHHSSGTISANGSGGFTVQGSNTYLTGGVFLVTVDISDFLGSALTTHNAAHVSSTINGGVAQALNISTRSFVQTGDNVLIGGFILSGPAPTDVIVRAIGPSLTGAGVSDALEDPTLELHDGSGAVIAFNDNWKDTQQAQIQATGIPPSDDRESAIVQTLAPGNYTAIVRGANDTTGVALVEVYNLQ